MFGKVVLDVDGQVFENEIKCAKKSAGVESDQELDHRGAANIDRAIRGRR